VSGRLTTTRPDVSLQTSYFAIPLNDVLELMAGVGLIEVQRIDDAFYQPLLIGTVPYAS
jgi:hypothetical protein